MTDDTELAAIRAADAESASTWFTKPNSFTALAVQNRRTLLRCLDAMTAERDALRDVQPAIQEAVYHAGKRIIELAAERDALKAELAKQRECNAVLADRWAARTVEWGELRAQVERYGHLHDRIRELDAALRKYGRHPGECRVWWGTHCARSNLEDCTCGLTALLLRLTKFTAPPGDGT